MDVEHNDAKAWVLSVCGTKDKNQKFLGRISVVLRICDLNHQQPDLDFETGLQIMKLLV